MVVTGILPQGDSIALADRVVPVLGFVVAITIVTELAADAGLFNALSGLLARWGRRRVWMLWLFVIVLSTLSTLFLSLDTTAVMVTPVVVLLALNAGLPPIPFALAAVWLANTASLLLPVSNLTNLLAAGQLGAGGAQPLEFAALVWAPAVVGVVVPVILLSLLFWRPLGGVKGRYTVPSLEPVADRRLLVVSCIVVVVLLPLLVSGLPVWIPSAAGALVLLVAFALRRRSALRWGLVPWSPVGIAAGLFVIVEAAQVHGLSTLVTDVAGSGDSFTSLLQLTGLGAVAANGINNLPAYLVLEPAAAGSPLRLAALLIGVNLGPLVTPWASLATLLWHERITALGVELRWSRFVVTGLVAVAVTLPLAVLALWLASGTP